MGKILSKCGAKLTQETTNDRKEGFYFAILTIDAHGKVMELDCRPSDAIVLAICERAPIRDRFDDAPTTRFEVFPMIISTGEGPENWRPLGLAVFGGLLALL